MIIDPIQVSIAKALSKNVSKPYNRQIEVRQTLDRTGFILKGTVGSWHVKALAGTVALNSSGGRLIENKLYVDESSNSGINWNVSKSNTKSKHIAEPIVLRLVGHEAA